MNMPRFVGDRTRAEPSLRLWLFVGLCGMLSTLLLVALAVDGTGNRSLGRASTSGLTPVAPVFLSKWPAEWLTWRAPAEEAAAETDRPTMSLVETLPVGDFALNSTLEATHAVLLRHTQQATRSIDISAMYWYVATAPLSFLQIPTVYAVGICWARTTASSTPRKTWRALGRTAARSFSRRCWTR
jgi:hypothetical protein